jgi:alpha-glucosidase
MRLWAPDRRPFILCRAGFAGIQRFAAVWTGDAPSTWESLELTLPMLLNMGLSGIPFVGSDVGGYSGNATPELFTRWMAVGSFSPFFRGHVTNGVNDQEPWAFGIEVEAISRSLIMERYKLLPYIYSLFAESSLNGSPLLRPLVYEFQDDPPVYEMGDEAMLGPFLLFAPIVKMDAKTRSIYFPPGRWFEAHSGAVYDGPASVELAMTLAALPIYVREGAIVPSSDPMMWTNEKPVDPLYLDIYPAPSETTFTLYEDGGDGWDYLEHNQSSRITYTLRQTDTGAALLVGQRQGLYVPPARTLVVRLHRADFGAASVMLSGSALSPCETYEELLSAGNGWWVDERDLSIVVAIPDGDDIELRFTYDKTIGDLRPPVLVPFVVTVPQGTPTDAPIYIATSATGWDNHIPLTWGSEANTAQGFIALPRGEWFLYKYTRGNWSTVEKWAGCMEATDRYGFGSAHPVRYDSVASWLDWCQ